MRAFIAAASGSCRLRAQPEESASAGGREKQIPHCARDDIVEGFSK